MSLIALLMLSDSRLPSGTLAHSGGLEGAAAAGRVRDAATLHDFLLGRLTSVGLTTAAFAAAAALDSGLAESVVAGDAEGFDTTGLAVLDLEYEARTASPAQRRVSRDLGKQLLRAVRAGWPCAALDAVAGLHGDGPHRPIAFGAAAATLGLDPLDTAAAAALGSVTVPANAVGELLGLDPDAVTAVLASLEPVVWQVTLAAAKAAQGPAPELPSLSAPLLDISAEHRDTGEARHFAS
jgi:urease accessory protein